MKALKIAANHYNCNYYLFPEGLDMTGFVEFLNQNSGKWVKMTKLSEKSAFPYFIAEDCETVYLNLKDNAEIREVEVTLVPKEEYIERLIAVVKKACINCASYHDTSATNGEIGNLRGHWSQINLDGECRSFHQKRDDCDDFED